MGSNISMPRRYAAFISYAHADEIMAARLHKALETYPVPRHLRAEGKTTKPVFRDVAELTASHSLSEKIRDAVKGSSVLIVLCSPAAKASHWVNEEIRLFRELHGEGAILSAIIEGTPETAFPDALIEGGREPLAAALDSDRAGFKLGVTQLAAGMLGTGLDDLVQRGAKRRQRIMGAGLAASLLLSGVMGFTALQAIEARNEAERARGDAEGLVEYMIKDLKVKLEPVGRLDILEGIGDKAVEYYDKLDIKSISDDSLNRQAAARQVLAQVHLDAGRMEEAQKEIEASAALTREVLERNPEDTDAIFAHAQSEFWVGKYYFDQGNYFEVEPYWIEYDRLSQKLYKIDPDNFDWIMEAAWSANALGVLYDRNSDFTNSAKSYESAAYHAKLAVGIEPQNPMPLKELANILAGQARAALYVKKYDDINSLLETQFKIFESKLSEDSQNKDLLYYLSSSKFRRFVDLTRFRENVEMDVLDASIEKLKALTIFDAKNITWLETYYAAQFFRLDYYYKTSDKRKFVNAYQEFRETGNLLFKSSNIEDRYFILARDLTENRHAYIIDEQDNSDSGLQRLNEKNMSVLAQSSRYAEIDALLMRENNDRGLDTYAIIFARKYLTYSWIKPIQQRPAILMNKAMAYALIGNCDDAKLDVEILLERGFSIPEIMNSHCP